MTVTFVGEPTTYFSQPAPTWDELRADPAVQHMDVLMSARSSQNANGNPNRPYRVLVPGNVDDTTTIIDTCADIPADLPAASVVAVEPKPDPNTPPLLIHHYVLTLYSFTCADLYAGRADLGNAPGSQIVWVGAPGTAPLRLPRDIGIGLGQGSPFRAFVVNMHYDNPSKLEGIEDR